MFRVFETLGCSVYKKREGAPFVLFFLRRGGGKGGGEGWINGSIRCGYEHGSGFEGRYVLCVCVFFFIVLLT